MRRNIVLFGLILCLLAHEAFSIQRAQGNLHNQQAHRGNLRVHTFSPSVSTQLSTSIKNKIITNLPKFTDQTFAQQLKEDLNQQKDSQRKLKQISVQSAEELFKIFDLKGIICDINGDGIIIKEELRCLNFIWKYYVPQDSQLEY